MCGLFLLTQEPVQDGWRGGESSCYLPCFARNPVLSLLQWDRHQVSKESRDSFNLKETKSKSLFRYESCNWTNRYHFDTALLLSVFLGMFGADRFSLKVLLNIQFVVRFYLGYPAVGLLKFSTLGFFFIGHLVSSPPTQPNPNQSIHRLNQLFAGWHHLNREPGPGPCRWEPLCYQLFWRRSAITVNWQSWCS